MQRSAISSWSLAFVITETCLHHSWAESSLGYSSPCPHLMLTFSFHISPTFPVFLPSLNRSNGPAYSLTLKGPVAVGVLVCELYTRAHLPREHYTFPSPAPWCVFFSFFLGLGGFSLNIPIEFGIFKYDIYHFFQGLASVIFYSKCTWNCLSASQTSGLFLKFQTSL